MSAPKRLTQPPGYKTSLRKRFVGHNEDRIRYHLLELPGLLPQRRRLTLMPINFFTSLKPLGSTVLLATSLNPGVPHSSIMEGSDTAPQVATRDIHSMIWANKFSSCLQFKECLCPSSRMPKPLLVRAWMLAPEASRYLVAARRPSFTERCKAVSPCRLRRWMSLPASSKQLNILVVQSSVSVES